MNNRIKLVRESARLSQKEFADALGISQSAISGMERGARQILDRTIHQIATEFGVSEEWLRTGEGEMYPGLPAEDDALLESFASSAIIDGSPTRKKFLTALCRLAANLDDAQILALCDVMENICSSVRSANNKNNPDES